MIRPSPLFRRFLAAFSALMMLLAPVVQVAHAQAMAHVAGDCAQPMASHHHGPSSQHAPQHQHDGTCCDFCATGCAAPFMMAMPGTAIAASVASARAAAGLPEPLGRVVLLPHTLPFSLAPPFRTA